MELEFIMKCLWFFFLNPNRFLYSFDRIALNLQQEFGLSQFIVSLPCVLLL